jgi:chromosome segregation ATPase
MRDNATSQTFYGPAAPGKLGWAATLLGVLLLLLAPGYADGQVRVFRSRAARARYWATVNAIQQQVDDAKSVLSVAESRAAMSQRQIDEAAQKLSSIRDTLEKERSNIAEAGKTLRAIEAEIVAAQPEDSDFAHAQAAVDDAKKALNREMRRVVSTTESGKLTPSQKEALEEDSAYRFARQEMQKAAKELDSLRQKLFRANEDWLAARREQIDAEKAAREQKKQAGTTGLGSLSDKQDLRTARGVASAAMTVVAMGELRLRQLGVRPRTPSQRSPGEQTD